MNKTKVIEFLNKNDIADIEEIDYNGEGTVLRFYYDFDNEEIEAARAYANDESEDEENGDVWYEEFFLPYLSDLAVDNVGEIIEEMMEELQIGAQFVSYEMDEEEYGYNEFIGVFFEEGKTIEIEDVLDKLEM